MKTINELLAVYGNEYLVCSGDVPCIGTGRIADEMTFYCLDEVTRTKVIEKFNYICGKDICRDTLITTLSGGQKVILMALLALYSPAKMVLFHNLRHNLDTVNQSVMSDLIVEFSYQKYIREVE